MLVQSAPMLAIRAKPHRIKAAHRRRRRVASRVWLPGQYYDSETGLNYNYFRDYEPATGRYVESDPLGLEGGLGTYAYVSGNPLRWADPSGLGPWDKTYGWSRAFWKWLHQEENGKLIKELKDPATGQVPKDVGQPYYDEWKAKQGGNDQSGFIDPDLLIGLLTPWWAENGNLGAPDCELTMTCNDPRPTNPCP